MLNLMICLIFQNYLFQLNANFLEVRGAVFKPRDMVATPIIISPAWVSLRGSCDAKVGKYTCLVFESQNSCCNCIYGYVVMGIFCVQ